jgi:hypothetical protein
LNREPCIPDGTSSWLSQQPALPSDDQDKASPTKRWRRRRQSKGTKEPGDLPLAEETRRAREAMEARQLKAIQNPGLAAASTARHKDAPHTASDADMNTDVEMPSTQEVFNKVGAAL